jgi:calcineurin-like phosphoesterase
MFLDGICDCVVGTHTHVQTNDARVLPKGTLYISDVGMTGALNGVIGVDKDIIVNRFIEGYTVSNKLATGAQQLNAVLITLEPNKSIIPIHLEEKI